MPGQIAPELEAASVAHARMELTLFENSDLVVERHQLDTSQLPSMRVALTITAGRRVIVDADIGPAIWTSHAQARGANAGAYASAADFATDDAVTHTDALTGIPVRIATGDSDPFHPGVETLARALPPGAVVEFSEGCHTSPFFLAQEPRSVAFLAQHLTRWSDLHARVVATSVPEVGRTWPGPHSQRSSDRRSGRRSV